MITYAPKTASGFQKLSSSAIEIGNIPLITGPIFGIILRTIAIKAFETTYLTFNIERTINDNRPTDNELMTIEKVQFANAVLHFSRIFLNLLRYFFGINKSIFSLYCFGSIEIIKLTANTNINFKRPEPKFPAIFIKFLKLS